MGFPKNNMADTDTQAVATPQSKRFGMTSFRIFGSSKPRSSVPPEPAVPIIPEQIPDGLAMPEAHAAAAADMQQEEALAAGEEAISKSAPRRISSHANGDRASRASHAGRVSAPPFLTPTDGEGALAALSKCMPCLRAGIAQ